MKTLVYLRSRRYLVTGASSGIGRATAVLLSQLGAGVVANGRDESRLDETMSLLENHGAEHLSAAFDMCATDDIPRWMTSLGRLDGLVHCAGVSRLVALRHVTAAMAEEAMRVNWLSAVAVCKGFRQKQVRADRGSIVLMSSCAVDGVRMNALYSSAKAAIVSLARSLAAELAQERIRVNCVTPGWVVTPMTDWALSAMTDAQIENIRAQHALDFGTADDIASCAAFLLSEASRWTTGANFRVDGGFKLAT
jgi:NAD(P)-dependent dehydrogenase (short-subunit alcohol dehydrogenase family)